MNTGIIIGIVIAVVVILALIVAGLVLARRRRISLHDDAQTQVVDGSKPQVDRSGGYKASSGFSFSQGGAASGTAVAEPPEPTVAPTERTEVDGQPGVGDDASVPRDSERRGITNVTLPDTADVETADTATTDVPTADTETTDSSATATAAPTADATETVDTTATAGTTDTAATTAESALTSESVPLYEDIDSSVTTPLFEEIVESVGESPDEIIEEIDEIEDEEAAATAPPRDEIEPTAGRLGRLRGRLSRSQGAIGKSMLGLLGAGDLDEESWEEIEDTLVMADLGSATTEAVIERLRTELATNPVRNADDARALLRRVLVEQLHPEFDRSIRALPHADTPAVVLVVGVNGTGKTTTTGKLARVLVADGRRVLLGAADTFRAAAADQLQTWGERVGADIVRGKEQADPAAVAFDAVAKGIDEGVDVVLIDTAGRLHTKTGLMDELGKVKRVVEKKAPVDEVILVLDATVGQNGLTQAKVFADVVDITGVALTKLDGTAKGGIVFNVQEVLGVPVKLVGLGEGADDLAPFDPEAFIDALL
ncbi:signal recognition particle-docking protein FtsY [Gordonia sp. 852002-50816_SCH5313054-c]|uniref:signal recognition particle-docking protein FtsY n=1 Tax=unclassified Gordonia (in: high G+C Gram-positive bacteria) TaxID=2657482 RepID=UPI0007EB7A0E|nr:MULTISPECIES: signal recognition particle-docking protein FtsY [unclassified Gordonia (in: high G+C Gram-positive bacteria)]OBC12802.1 signal recognition particle-docking protein FtsY [Gordonia sp. 852002-50816_SCH5313054-a]OBC18798.1 signal recognition particle-docking protein FtsY [Gordonia sp. 852002-50816_SCH5313054-c]